MIHPRSNNSKKPSSILSVLFYPVSCLSRVHRQYSFDNPCTKPISSSIHPQLALHLQPQLSKLHQQPIQHRYHGQSKQRRPSLVVTLKRKPYRGIKPAETSSSSVLVLDIFDCRLILSSPSKLTRPIVLLLSSLLTIRSFFTRNRSAVFGTRFRKR